MFSLKIISAACGSCEGDVIKNLVIYRDNIIYITCDQAIQKIAIFSLSD